MSAVRWLSDWSDPAVYLDKLSAHVGCPITLISAPGILPHASTATRICQLASGSSVDQKSQVARNSSRSPKSGSFYHTETDHSGGTHEHILSDLVKTIFDRFPESPKSMVQTLSPIKCHGQGPATLPFSFLSGNLPDNPKSPFVNFYKVAVTGA